MALLFAFSFAWAPLFGVGQLALAVALVLMGLDAFALLAATPQKFLVTRELGKILSLGDVQEVVLKFSFEAPRKFKYELLDELPYQLQIRDFSIKGNAAATGHQSIKYSITPKTRGAYIFGNTVLMVQYPLGLFKRRYVFENEKEVPVYPSTIQLKKMELRAVPHMNQYFGLKKIRRIGHSYEFEQIKNYVAGDDYRSLNWKRSSRFNELMVNQFQDEKSQAIYCIIDKGRQMRAPFDGLKLLDYSINAALVLCSTAIKKNDRAGLITFKENIDTTLKAAAGQRHLNKIFEALYRETESTHDANFELLFRLVRQAIRNRSLLFLFTNIESATALDRWMPIFKAISKMHLLVLVVFENAPLVNYGFQSSETVQEVYLKLAARQQVFDKKKMALQLRKQGIQVILTPPELLTVNTINKYLELKARGMI